VYDLRPVVLAQDKVLGCCYPAEKVDYLVP
jgi:hypothetical protein